MSHAWINLTALNLPKRGSSFPAVNLQAIETLVNLIPPEKRMESYEHLDLKGGPSFVTVDYVGETIVDLITGAIKRAR